MARERVWCSNCRKMVVPKLSLRGISDYCPRCDEPVSGPPELPRRSDRSRRDDRYSRDEPKRRSGLMVPLAIGGGLVFLGVATLVIVVVVLLTGKKDGGDPAAADSLADVRPAEGAARGQLPDEAVESVKRATVYIRVTMVGPRGQVVGSGSGFLVARDGHIITNSHVVSAPREVPGARIRKIEIVFHSGQPNSFTAEATVVRSDPGPDLALLRVQPLSLPDPLILGDSSALKETHDVYIFGFPLGEQLGRAITVSKSSVSSLRRDRQWPEIQVNGGMHPGNSGGPVTDANGKVVGVAVAGIVGTQINFAIPSETVRTFIQSAVKGDPVASLPPDNEPEIEFPPPGNNGPGIGLPPLPDLNIPKPPRPSRPLGPAAKIETPAGTRPTRIMGGAFDPEYYDSAPKGSLLVGLELGLGKFINHDVIHAVRPIYRGADGKETFGKQRGTELDRVVKLKAKTGYAVGAMSIKTGLGLDSLTLTYMKVVDGKLDPSDTYESEKVGGPGGGGPFKLGGDGSPVIGIVGKTGSEHASGLGLLLGPEPGRENEPPGLRETVAAGGAFARNEYREVRSDGSILIGFEVGLGQVFNHDIINYLRPIWSGPKGERLGIAYGKRPAEVTTVKARNGYALGGVVVVGGGALEGICFTFMRKTATGLDPAEAYTSDWYGRQTRKPRPNQLRAGSDGSRVVGIYGKRFEDRGGDQFNDGGAIGTIGLVLAPRAK